VPHLQAQDRVLEVDLAYELLAIEIYRRNLVAHELLLCRLSLLKYVHLGLSADHKQDIVVLAGELDAFALEENHRDDLALLD
jgi:hypothetical protein